MSMSTKQLLIIIFFAPLMSVALISFLFVAYIGYPRIDEPQPTPIVITQTPTREASPSAEVSVSPTGQVIPVTKIPVITKVPTKAVISPTREANDSL